VSGGGSGAVGHVATPEPSLAGRRAWCHGTRDHVGALPCWEVGSGTAGHVVTLEPFRVALPCREVGSSAMGHVVTPEPCHAGRWGLAPWDTW
jgi:hypothetical protein